ncbi:MAG TPA: AAA family ATPase [Terriglobales bacterium]
MTTPNDWVPHFPPELKDISSWCLWKLLVDEKGRPTKVPFQCDNRFKASCDNPSTWSSFDEACRALECAPSRKAGLGFQLGLEQCGFIFVDLDSCRNPQTGELAAWAEKYLERHPTFVEVTPSGTGLRAIYRGDMILPNGLGTQKWYLQDMPGLTSDKRAQIEVFLHHKYVAVTGDLFDPRLRTIEAFVGDLPAELDQLAKEYPPAVVAVQEENSGRITRTRYAPGLTGDEKLERLRAGDWHSLGYQSASEAELAFSTLVAIHHLRAGGTEGELSAIIESEVRGSALYRKKWDRKTYRDLTIPRAIKSAVATVNQQSGKDATAVRKLDITSITDHPIRPITWQWPNRIPSGKLTGLSGHPDTGKTNVALDVIARATTGRDWPDGAKNTTPPCNALVLAAEDSVEDTIRPRLQAAGADESRIEVIRSTYLEIADSTGQVSIQTVTTALDKDCELLRQALLSRPNTKIVLIDPITTYLGSAKWTDEQQIRKCLYPLQQMAEELDVAVLLITHLNRTAGLAAKQKTMVAGLDKLCRAVWGFADDKAKGRGHYATVSIKKNVGHPAAGLTYQLEEVVVGVSSDQRITAPRVKWTGETNLSMDDLLRQEDGSTAKLRHAVGWLASALFSKGGKASSAVLYAAADIAGIDRKDLSAARKYLGLERYCGGDGKSWWKFVVGKATSNTVPAGTKNDTASTDGPVEKCLFDEDDGSDNDSATATL